MKRLLAGSRSAQLLTLASVGLFCCGLSAAPPRLPSYDDVEQRIKELVQQAPRIERQEIGRSAGGRAIHVVTVASSEPSQNGIEPREIVVVAGLEGTQPAGVLSALRALQTLSRESMDLPADVRIHVIPVASPDAWSAWTAAPLHPHDRNALPFDDDRDRRVDEDPVNDLDGNGVVTAMRVIDPDGEWLISPAEPRLLRRADRDKGEVGRYRLLLEGIDDDGDRVVNEDLAGGIVAAHNFPHDFPEHGTETGRYPLESPEALAIAEYLLAHPRTALLVNLSSFDCVTKELETGVPAGGFPRSPATKLHPDDQPAITKLVEAFRATLGIDKNSGKTSFPSGDLTGYGYFHLGIPSISHPLWTEPRETSDEPKPNESDPNEERKPKSEKPELHKSLGVDSAWLHHADANPDLGGFVPWKAFEHPTLGSVEIGGFTPGFREIPPSAEVIRIGDALARFLAKAAGMLPRISVEQIVSDPRPGGVHRIELRVRNTGELPLALRQAVTNRHVRNGLVKLELNQGELLTGPKLGRIPSLAPGASQRFEWWINGPEGQSITLEVDTVLGGSVSRKIVLGAKREAF